MNFRDDRRAVTVQVGSVLLFGILILSMSMYQAQVVPTDNERVEFDHNQRVQQELLDARNAILRSANTDATHPVSISLGARYPNRVLFVNPPPASGRLSMTERVADGIEIENARAVDGETADYWTGEDIRSFETRSLEYTPDYTQYRNPPTTVYENSVLYNRFGGGATLPQSEQTLVDGRRISLVSLDGEVSAARTGATSVDVRPASASTRTTTVTSDDEPIRISLATELSEDDWRELLESETEGGYVEDVAVDDGILTITLEADETYSLRMAKVGVGSNVGETEAAYVTDVSGDDETVRAGTNRMLVAEVRDGFGNPVTGEELDAEVTTGDGSVTFPEGRTTDSEGRLRVVYEAPEEATENENVEVDIGYGEEAAEYATFELTVPEGSGSSGDDSDDGTAASSVSYDGDAEPFWESSTVRFNVSNDGSDPVTVEAITVDTDAAGNLQEQNGGQNQPGQHELYLDTDESGYYEAGDDDDSRYRLGTRAELTERATAEAGSDVTFSLLYFRESESGDEVDMQNEELTVSLRFADGSSKSMTFTVGTY
ncbi:hypothetical protein [Haloprofundus halobius]|uniref:hypothetical protein n=1 Tax=Haloprofundus halobius TaxID=2876194 RepID=UPI001CD02A08|nr:hypothetical protein [Haloprofundus halobius]